MLTPVSSLSRLLLAVRLHCSLHKKRRKLCHQRKSGGRKQQRSLDDLFICISSASIAMFVHAEISTPCRTFLVGCKNNRTFRRE
ncbi:hypothetical protein BDR03DRAFT_710932 [Suillus americanus]|nr:hypothetical protein BDR03DRAFT_710932 [Suillus americanus]